MAESMRSTERDSGLAFAFKVGEHEQMSAPPSDFPHDCGHFEAPPVSRTSIECCNQSFVAITCRTRNRLQDTQHVKIAMRL